MPNPSFSVADFARALTNLLPSGRAWNRDPDSVQAQAIASYAPTFQRQAESARALLVDSFPGTAVHLLPEWEATLGLPDPCAGIAPTIEARRAQVVARLVQMDGQSVSDFVAYAAGLGYSVTVTQCAPFRMGQSAMNQPLGNTDWFFAWQVNAPLATEQYTNSVLECELLEAKPSHTVLTFHYS